jgi:hypothetical protein
MKKTILTYVLAVFFCILFIVGVASSFFYSTVFNVEKHMERLEKNKYDETVLITVYTQLDGIGDVVALDTDDIYDLLDKDKIVEYSKDYTKTYLSSILNNESFSKATRPKYNIKYAKTGLKRLVMEFYETSPNSFSEEEFEIIYNYIETQINNSLEFLSPVILEQTLPAAEIISYAKGIIKYTRFALIASGILILLIIWINRKKGIGSILYRTGATLFIPSATLFIPIFLFDRYNLGSKVVLLESPLSAVVKSVLDTIIKGFRSYIFVFFAISFALILAGAAITILQLNSEKKSDPISTED